MRSASARGMRGAICAAKLSRHARPRARHARGEHELEGKPRAVGGHEHRLVVDGDDALARGLAVGAEIEGRADVVDEVVGGVEVVDQRHDFRVGLAQVLDEDAVLVGRALGRRDQQVFAVVRGMGAEAPFLFIRAVVHQHVGALRGADLVEVQLLEVVHVGQLGRFLRLVVAAVEEALAVVRP